jgi:hypothetical protein
MDILTGLTFGLSEIEMSDEYLLQVSGMEYTYDGTKPEEERLVSVKINGNPIDPMATYSVTTNEMLLGFMAYLGIVPANLNILTGVTEFEALSEFVMGQNNFIQPKTLGRVLNVGNQNARSTVIGAGWMNSSSGFYKLDKNTKDKLFFEFNMIDRGLNFQPSGKVTIRYPQANLIFKSDMCDWLLLDNQVATLTGTGKINNQGNYGYMLVANDQPDKLRIVIWDKNNSDKIIYDNLTPQNIQGAIVMHNRIILTKDSNEELSLAPVEFSLDQNYPNPFNPSTTINYSISEAGNVEMKVYDILGNQVATLVNEAKAPGNYSAVFDASSLASGIYIYKLSANNFLQTKKMILIK